MLSTKEIGYTLRFGFPGWHMLLSLFVFYPVLTMAHLRQNKIEFDRLTTEDGLSSNMINAIIQDYQGFIWIGTNGGLNKYDGNKVTVYKSSYSDTTTIADNNILAIIESRQQKIFVVTHFGMNEYDRDKDRFIRHGFSRPSKSEYMIYEVGDVVEDHQGLIWFDDHTGGVTRFDPRNGELKKYKLSNNRIGALLVDSNGQLWVGTMDNEFNWYNPETDSFLFTTNTYFFMGNIPQDCIWTIVEDTPGHLLIGTSGGIFGYNIAEKTFYQTNIIPHLSSGFRNNEVKWLFRESDEQLWIGTWGRGLNIFNRRTGKLTTYVVEPNNPSSLSNNDVNIIFKDVSGVYWIGTQDGLNIIDPAKGMFTHYQNDPGDANSLSLNFVTSFYEDTNGKIWIGTYGDGLNIFDPVTEKFTYVKNDPFNSNSLVNNAIRAICEDDEGYIWIGTMKGLNRYDPKTGNFLLFQYDPDNDNSICGNDILSVVKGVHGDVWVGTYGDGFCRIEPILHEQGQYRITRFRHNENLSNFVSSDFVRCLQVDQQGIVWIGTLGGGLDRYDPNNGLFTNYTAYPGNIYSLSNNNINAIMEDRFGRLWITTWNGLNRFEKDTERFFAYRLEDGLTDNMVCEVQEDHLGYFWVSTFKGLSRFDPDGDPRFIDFNTNYGLQGSKFNINASLKARDGTLYFGGTTGFNVFNPAEIRINKYIPDVVLTGVKINNKEVKIGQKERGLVSLDKSIGKASSITLYYRARLVSFEFAAMSYSMKVKNQVAYKLENYDDDWVLSDSKNTFAVYNNLAPGEYRFLVKAANSSGIWNNTPRELRIKVMPPPWLTWWAIVIYSIIIASLLYAARSITLTQAGLRHNLKLQQMERENAEKINDMKLKFFTNISHEFKTPLTLIFGPLQKLLAENTLDVGVKSQLQIIDRNSRRLLNLINQLMDFRKTETGNLQLSVYEGDIILSLHTIKEAFNEFSEEHKIVFNQVSNVSSKHILFDKDKFEKIMYNLLSNAFKFTPEKGQVSIVVFDPSKESLPDFVSGYSLLNAGLYKDSFLHIKDLESYVFISVIDNGIGMSKDRSHKIFERFYQINKSSPLRHSIKHTGTGIGLSLTRELVELHHGQIVVESMEGRGACFTLALPNCRDCYKEDELIAVQFDADTQEELIALPGIPDDEAMSAVNRKINYSDIGLHDADKKTILVVDDNKDILRFLHNNLNEEFRVLTAQNGREGLELAMEHVPDLVISDVMMPEMDGNQLCEKIKTDVRTSHIPVILLTAYSSSDSYVSGIELGADDYIPKPFNMHLLLIRIRNLIISRENLHRLFSNELSVHTRKTPFNTLDEKFLRQAIQIVEINLDDPEFSVDLLGKEVGMSRTNLFRKLKALTSQPPSEFIRTIRVKKAARLLLEGYNVSEVTYQVGINSRSYFIKCFSEQFGMTPTDFIKQYQKQTPSEKKFSGDKEA